MKITIIGMGNAGSTVGADLASKGHEITLLKTSNRLHQEHFDYVKESRHIILDELGCERKVSIACVTTSYKEALSSDTELIIVYVQTNYHEDVINKMLPYLHDGEMVLFEPGYLSTAYLLNKTDKKIISIEATSSPIDCRISRPGYCTVLFKNVRNPIGIYPRHLARTTLDKLQTLGYNFFLLDSVIEAALHNPNLIVHTIGAIMSVPRIEYTRGEYWMYKEVFTPKVWNLVEALDEEKMQILQTLGLRPLKYVEACKFRNFLEEDIDAKEAFFDYANNHSPKGPFVADSRYITEDVPQGLCLLESLGELLGVKTRVATALIDLASSLLQRDFRVEGRNIDKFSKKTLDKIIQDFKSK